MGSPVNLLNVPEGVTFWILRDVPGEQYPRQFPVSLKSVYEQLKLGPGKDPCFMKITGSEEQARIYATKTAFVERFPDVPGYRGTYKSIPGVLDGAYRDLMMGEDYDEEKDPGRDPKRWELPDDKKK
jgi:hypothetical protein